MGRKQPDKNSPDALIDTFTCHIAKLIHDHPTDKCLHCPACSLDEELMKRCKHRCPHFNMHEIFVSPGSEWPIDGCGYSPAAACMCTWCNTAAHTTES